MVLASKHMMLIRIVFRAHGADLVPWKQMELYSLEVSLVHIKNGCILFLAFGGD